MYLHIFRKNDSLKITRLFIVAEQCFQLLICIRLHKYKQQQVSDLENYCLKKKKKGLDNMTGCICLPSQSGCVRVCVGLFQVVSVIAAWMRLHNRGDGFVFPCCVLTHTLNGNSFGQVVETHRDTDVVGEADVNAEVN